MTNQSAQQASVRLLTGSTYDYQGDWAALFDLDGIASGPWDQRCLAWINSQLGVTYTELPSAMTAYAVQNGADSWQSMGTFTSTADGLVALEGAGLIALEAGTFFMAME